MRITESCRGRNVKCTHQGIKRAELVQLKIYRVNCEDFFQIKHDERIRSEWKLNRSLCEKPITELISRYDLNSKRILSVGPSYGHEEYWFYKKGKCFLTFVDIDEGHTIERYLGTLGMEKGHQPYDVLTYAIGDAREFRTESASGFDVCYFSSFTPDMIKNREIASRIREPLKSRMLRRISYGLSQNYSGNAWPENENPLSDLTTGILQNALNEDGGLLIYQSFASNVDARTPGYIAALGRQLEKLSISLIEGYYFVGYPSVHMVVGLRGNESFIQNYLHRIRNNPELTRIHGRAAVQFRGILKIFDTAAEKKKRD